MHDGPSTNGGDSLPGETSRPAHKKVKTGCRTCKIRKVKCDQGRPSCRRCLATGRTCDGYGIWGGGGQPYHQPVAQSCHAVLRQAPSVIRLVGEDEKLHFEWFTYRTAIKLPGVFGHPFWEKLVFQACFTEPAVLHAVLAFGALHKSESPSRGVKEVPACEREQFMLQQYSKAIGHLQPHLAAGGRDSVRVALVVCVVFTSLEFLRGEYQSSILHLRSGIKMLLHLGRSQDAIVDEPYAAGIEDRLADTFAALDLNATLFGEKSAPNLVGQQYVSRSLPVLFDSILQARRSLDRLLRYILLATDQSRQPYAEARTQALAEQRRCLQADLARWLVTYEASRVKIQSERGAAGAFAHQLLRIDYTMASIMGDMCQHPDEEMLYDAHRDKFAAILSQSEQIHKAARLVLALPEYAAWSGVCTYVADTATTPALYYAALKSRDHDLRHRAIRYLLRIPHKEATWDSTLTAEVAKVIVGLEEQDWYRSCGPCGEGTATDYVQSVLPANHRVSAVRIQLQDTSRKAIIVRCRRRRDDGTWKHLTIPVALKDHWLVKPLEDETQVKRKAI